jgi:hypothetical protein
MTTNQSIIPVSSLGTQVMPEFIRLPKAATLCAHTGLSRSIMNELILPCEANNRKPPVRSILLRKPGNIGGVRLVDYRSLVDFLRSLENQTPES